MSLAEEVAMPVGGRQRSSYDLAAAVAATFILIWILCHLAKVPRTSQEVLHVTLIGGIAGLVAGFITRWSGKQLALKVCLQCLAAFLGSLAYIATT